MKITQEYHKIKQMIPLQDYGVLCRHSKGDRNEIPVCASQKIAMQFLRLYEILWDSRDFCLFLGKNIQQQNLGQKEGDF